jgi:hypothetical protein
MIKFPLTEAQIQQGREEGFGEIVADNMQELFEYYLNNHEMPYGVAKARTGDPDQWICDRLEEEFVG